MRSPEIARDHPAPAAAVGGDWMDCKGWTSTDGGTLGGMEVQSIVGMRKQSIALQDQSIPQSIKQYTEGYTVNGRAAAGYTGTAAALVD
jgi:hypothetical protein